MQSMITKALVVLVGCVVSAVAAPFNANVVYSDASWVMHVDFAALRGSQIGKAMLEGDIDAAAQEQLEKAKEMLGMDPRTDLHAVTVYGTAANQEDFVAIINGNLDSNALEKQVRDMPGYTASSVGARDMHSWLADENESESRMFGVVLDGTRAVMSRSEATLGKGLAVLDGEQGNLSQATALDTALLSGQGVLLAMTADLSGVDFSQNPMLAQANVSAKSVRMQLREAAGNLGLRVAVQQGTVQEAQQSEEMLNGLKMMGVMQLGQQNPDLAGLMQAITIGRTDDTLLLNLSYPAEQFLEIVKGAVPPGMIPQGN